MLLVVLGGGGIGVAGAAHTDCLCTHIYVHTRSKLLLVENLTRTAVRCEQTTLVTFNTCVDGFNGS